jgi:predicted anti-sigma-YlaC factor YlaD
MSLTPDEIQKMLDVIRATRDVEIDCDACLNQVGEFAESHLNGKAVPEGLRAVEQHLSICGECREEFEALCQAIKSLDRAS